MTIETRPSAAHRIATELGDTTMKNTHNITDRFTGSVIFTAEIQVADDAPMALRLGAATAVAVAAKADLSEADLSEAYLRGAKS